MGQRRVSMGRPFRVVFVPTLRVEIAAQTRPTHRVVPALTLRPSCRVVFFSVVRRAARRVWPIWTSIPVLVLQEGVRVSTCKIKKLASANSGGTSIPQAATATGRRIDAARRSG
jgi:hypothetical protein